MSARMAATCRDPAISASSSPAEPVKSVTSCARHFHAQGHCVTVLARHPNAERVEDHSSGTLVTFDTWAQALDGADVVINLAGR
jgi:hypothetical protein